MNAAIEETEQQAKDDVAAFERLASSEPTPEEKPEEKEKAKEPDYSPVIKDITIKGAQADVDKLKFTKSFSFDYVDVDGVRLHGVFTVKRMALGDYSRMGVIRGRLDGGEVVMHNTAWLHEVLSFCAVALTNVPDWWKPEAFYDTTMLDDVYAYARAYQDTFRRQSVA